MHANSFLDGTSVFYDDSGCPVKEIRNCSRELAEQVMDLVEDYLRRQEVESARWSNLNVHFEWPGENLKVRVGDRIHRLKLNVDRSAKERIVEFISAVCNAVMAETGAEGKLITTHDLD